MSLKKQSSSEAFSDLAPYQDQDTQQFEKLNEQIQSRQSHSNRSESRQEKPVHHRFSYSESDAAQFQKILPDVNAAVRQETPISDDKTNSGFGSVYKQSDNDQFQALMDFNGNRSRDHDAKPANSNLDERSFSYSEQDLQAFNQLTLGGLTNKESTSDKLSHSPTRSEHDVGPIKIIDFDSKKSKTQKTVRQSKLNIKVRYFD